MSITFRKIQLFIAIIMIILLYNKVPINASGSAGAINNERALNEALKVCETVRLDDDVMMKGPLVIDDGKNHVIDLNGFGLKRKRVFSNTDNGSVIIIKNQSTKLTIKDSSSNKTGFISGGYAKCGGGIRVENSARLTVIGCLIESNYANKGGGIYVGNDSKAVITDSRISTNNGCDLFGAKKVRNFSEEMNALVVFAQHLEMSRDCDGGGIRVEATATCEINNTVIDGNRASGGAGISNYGKLEIMGSAIRNNFIIESGGLQMGAGIYNEGEASINDTEIIYNTRAANGGGIANKGNIFLEECTISNNSTHGRGGGVYSQCVKKDKKIVFSGSNKITQNTAEYGGGMFVTANGSSEHGNVLKNIKINSNQATKEGGAIFIDKGLKEIACADINMEQNNSDGNGGAAACYSPTRFDDCEIRLNNSKGDGGGIYADFSGAKYNVTITKTAVQENICQGSGGGIYLKDEKKNGKIVLGGGKTIINYNKNKKSDNDNISFKVFREIKVIGGFKTGSIIGVSCKDSCDNRLLTKGYSEYNKDAADLYFTFDDLDYKISGDEKLPEAKVIKKLVPSAKGYKIKFEIKVTNDADDWDEAYVVVYCRKANGVGSELKKYTTDDITDSIDHKDGQYTSGEIDCGDDFPTKINVYANFGGGLVIRGWEADVKIWINGENSGSTHIKRKLTGNTKKKGVADNWINIGGDKYPYLYDYEINQKREIDLTDDKTKEVSIKGVDQYGVEWKSAGMDYIKMENKSFPGEDTFKCLDGKGLKWKFDTSKTKVCHNSIYCLKFKSGSNIQEWTELIIGVRFRVPLYVTVRIGNEKTAYKQVQKITGRQSEVIEVKIPDAGKGYIVDKVKNEGTCYITPPEEGGDVYKVTLGAQDVIMTFITSPIKYKIEFDKNATEGNKVSGSIVKMSVSYDEAKKLSKNVFKSKNGYKFAGWNTKADGTGKSYKDGEEIINLSSINKDVVTLYAQWEDEDGNLVTASLFSDGTYGTQIIFLFLVSVAIVMGSKLAVKKRG